MDLGGHLLRDMALLPHDYGPQRVQYLLMFLNDQKEIYQLVIWSQNLLGNLLLFFTLSPRLNLLAIEFTKSQLKNLVKILLTPSLRLPFETLFVTLSVNLFKILLSKTHFKNLVLSLVEILFRLTSLNTLTSKKGIPNHQLKELPMLMVLN